MNDEYYILSLKNSPADGCALWWRPNDAGYTTNLLKAGRYPVEQVEGEPGYYNNGETTRAVKCSEVETIAAWSVDWSQARKSWVNVATPNSQYTK